MIFPYLIYPWLPTNCDEPQTLYSIMNSICNFGATEKTNIYDLASGARSTIFDFQYPLSTHVNKEEFETLILKHFIMRRIGFETPTAFKLALEVKLNEIMPLYNKLFDALDGWDLFNSGESVTRVTTDNGSNTLNNTVTANNTNISDRRNSNVPQNQLSDIANGTYMTDYNLDTDTSNGTTLSNTEGTNANTTNETIIRTPADKIKIYKDFIESKNNIYTMIFKDLESLFYSIV